MQITQLFSFYRSPYELEENQHNLIHRNISQLLHKEDKDGGNRSREILPVEWHVKDAELCTRNQLVDGNFNMCVGDNLNIRRLDGFILLLY